MDKMISIGVLAYNEESCIKKMIMGLFDQMLLKRRGLPYQVEVCVVANGCLDNTVAVARRALDELSRTMPRVSGHVFVLDRADKSNAWNNYIHKFSSQQASYYILLDADIEFADEEVLCDIVVAAEASKNAKIVVDVPLKDIAKKQSKNFFDRLSLHYSDSRKLGLPKISGQLYCGEGRYLRTLFLPVGLPVEDGYLRAVTLTDSFRHEENFDYIERIDDVHHYFSGLSFFSGLVRHEIRLTLGSMINMILFDYLYRRSQCEDINLLINENNRNNPKWLEGCVNEYVEKNGYRKIFSVFAFRRVLDLKNISFRNFIINFCISITCLPLDFYITLRAILLIKRSQAIGYW